MTRIRIALAALLTLSTLACANGITEPGTVLLTGGAEAQIGIPTAFPSTSTASGSVAPDSTAVGRGGNMMGSGN